MNLFPCDKGHQTVFTLLSEQKEEHMSLFKDTESEEVFHDLWKVTDTQRRLARLERLLPDNGEPNDEFNFIFDRDLLEYCWHVDQIRQFIALSELTGIPAKTLAEGLISVALEDASIIEKAISKAREVTTERLLDDLDIDL